MPLDEAGDLLERIREQEKRLSDKGRAFVRYSGTELKIRLLVEALDESLAREVFAAIEEVLRKELKFL
jgi:phosphomannomutase